MTGEARILRAAERSAAPWSNGGGVTREVAAHPPGAGWDSFAWRVSLADVGRDGPYSPLPGVRRILTVVEGGGLELTVDGTRHLLADRYRPFAFPGGAATDCRLLAGPVVNLNVMLRDGRAAATVETVRGTRTLPPLRPADPDSDVPDALVVVALQGSALLAAAGRPPVRLGRFDAALLSGPGTAAAELRTDGTAAVIALTAGR
ncbi:HutD/Ves family protein [Streptomyces lydicus]|uniref:HutD/Ves family protein n=1 Tax=Streptomyces lydicus TaxID=47763 RepID=UPI0005247B40|nr:HutD family protein [Streptomyces lydicus]MDC7336936.1 HutD family protein [Streptomyces lydicus]UEG93704.1 HutD family protein [Streptomyces lydicus]